MTTTPDRLAGKTALITAAAAGIGRATAEAFSAQGAKVIATDIDEDGLAPLSTLPNLTLRRLDVTDGDAVGALIAETGPLDILFNCAGFVADGTIADCDEATWDFTMNLNAKGMYRTMRAAIGPMLEQGGGSIINMSSVASSLKGVPNRFAYCASKAAVIGMSKAVATDYVTRGIRCNAICPGTIDSPSLRGRLASTGNFDAAMEEFVGRQPMGRLGQPEEIADIAVYLASDESRFVTGQALAVDGGWTI